MKTYHIDKLAYSSSEPFAIKKEGAVGGGLVKKIENTILCGL